MQAHNYMRTYGLGRTEGRVGLIATLIGIRVALRHTLGWSVRSIPPQKRRVGLGKLLNPVTNNKMKNL